MSMCQPTSMWAVVVRYLWFYAPNVSNYRDVASSFPPSERSFRACVHFRTGPSRERKSHLGELQQAIYRHTW